MLAECIITIITGCATGNVGHSRHRLSFLAYSLCADGTLASRPVVCCIDEFFFVVFIRLLLVVDFMQAVGSITRGFVRLFKSLCIVYQTFLMSNIAELCRSHKNIRYLFQRAGGELLTQDDLENWQ